MAKREITIDDGSNGRKQVELNLNPVSIQPTIRNGGNYRIAVQQTPKTNAALQLSEALKAGVQVYGQGVKLAQTKAVADVESMSEADFDTFLNEGLDEESRSIFGYTKSYNQALAKKYYTQELPKKLQSIASDLHKDPYQYKTPEEFDAAASEAVSGAYDEADALLGGNVFGEQANNALKSKTMSDFVAKQQATYLERLPAITKQTQEEIAFQAFDELTAESNVLVTLEQQMGSNASALGNVIGNKVTTTSFLDTIELKIENGDLTQAAELIGELDSTDEAILNGQGRRKIDGVEIFNTKENRSRLEKLEDKLETAGVENYNKRLVSSQIAQAEIEVELFSLLKGEGDTETKGLARLNEIDAEIAKNGSVTLNGVVYDDAVELRGITQFTAGARNNKALFVHNAKLNFLQQNIGRKQVVPNELLSVGSMARMNPEASQLLFSSAPNGVTGKIEATYTPEGLDVISGFGTELEQLEFELVDSLLSDSGLSQGDRITEFSNLYPTMVTAKLQEWLTTRMEAVVPDKTDIEMKAVDAGLSVPQQAQYKAISDNTNLSKEEIRMSQEDFLTQNQARIESELFITGKDGSRELNTKGKVFKINPAIPYKKAIDNGFFKDSVEQSKALDVVFDSFTAMDGVNQPAKNSLIREFNSRLNFPNEDTVLQRSEKNANVRQTLSLNGVSLEEVANDSYRSVSPHYNRSTGINTPITLSAVYGTKSIFTSTPVLIDGSIANTVRLVESYFFDKENTVLPENIKKAAKAHGISVGHMMVQMNAYLTDNNFIKK